MVWVTKYPVYMKMITKAIFCNIKGFGDICTKQILFVNFNSL